MCFGLAGLDLNANRSQHPKIAFYDPLTGLATKPLFLDLLNREINKAKGNGTSLVVFFIDLNDFKTINDTLGHQAGDQLLAGVGKRLIKCLRQSDLICRPMIVQDPDDDQSQVEKLLKRADTAMHMAKSSWKKHLRNILT